MFAVDTGMLETERTVLVVVDMQEPFLRGIFERERVLQNVCTLIGGAKVLGVPVIATTQYAERMGDVVPEVREGLGDAPALDKMTFSCAADRGFMDNLNALERRQVLLCGVESHICVCQTALQLNSLSFTVHLAEEAVSSRSEANWRLGVARMRQAGIVPTSVETALYEMLHCAGTPQFKAILKLIK